MKCSYWLINLKENKKIIDKNGFYTYRVFENRSSNSNSNESSTYHYSIHSRLLLETLILKARQTLLLRKYLLYVTDIAASSHSGNVVQTITRRCL